MTKMQESDAHLQRRRGAPLCGAFSFAAGAVGGNKKGGGGIAARGKENFIVLRFVGAGWRFCAFLPVFGVFRGETRGGGRGAVEKIGENGKIRSFRAFFTTLRFC